MRLSTSARLQPLLLAAALLVALPLRAQDAEVPRTHTLPGIENPAFPYAQPEEVGLSSEKLNRLGDAYHAAGRLEDARRNYERAVDLAEEEGHENLVAYRGKLERVTQQLEDQER